MSDSIRRISYEESGKVQKPRSDNALAISAGTSAVKLPEEIIEIIISRIPFPFLFKARLLSRTWCFKFRLVQRTSKTLLLWRSRCFENLISSVSFKWPIYGPIYVSRKAITGFDRASARWQIMMDMSHLPISTWSSVSCGGPLICVMKWDKTHDSLDVFVTNPITRGWRKLDFHLSGGEPAVLQIIMQGLHDYQVLLVSRDAEGVCSHVYDSSCRTYKRTIFEEENWSHIYPATAYLDGNLYCMFGNLDPLEPVNLWKYNVKNNEWSIIPHRPAYIFDNVRDCGVLLCGGKVMVALCINMETRGWGPTCIHFVETCMHIWELDVLTLKLKPVSLGKVPDMEIRCGIHQKALICGGGAGDEVLYLYPRKGQMHFASDSDCIYFGEIFPDFTMLTYNIHADEWDCLPPISYRPGPAAYNSNLTSRDVKWTRVPFQPGLCPFMMV